MQKFILLVFICFSLSNCKKNNKSSFTVKYEVQGSSSTGYDIAYTNELGQTSYTQANNGWTYQINGKSGQCYKLTIIPHQYCSNSGTGNIFFNNSLKATKSVTQFSESVPNQIGGMSCGFTITACN